MMKKKIITIFGILMFGMLAFAAKLPEDGATPPAILRGPVVDPGEPGDTAPIGSGLALLLGMSASYYLIKRKKK